MELGKKIRQLRFRSNLTQEQLAEKLGISPQSVSKWENAVAMPDISLLPLLAETFGVSIDDLFDLTNEQRFNRIESRLDREDELPQDAFLEYERFLKEQILSEQYKKRATNLLAYLYWHRMDYYARMTAHYAKEAVWLSPNEKGCQWMLQKAEGHAAWDWNVANHTSAIEFYREVVQANPDSLMSYTYLLDNLIADRRTDEAEDVLERMNALKDSRPVINEFYRAHIALAKFDETSADRIVEKLAAEHEKESSCQFEAAQYYAGKGEYEKAIACYERSFENTTRKPRFMDELQGIADIYQITEDYHKAAGTYDRIIELLQTEWGMTEESTLQNAKKEKARLLDKIRETDS